MLNNATNAFNEKLLDDDLEREKKSWLDRVIVNLNNNNLFSVNGSYYVTPTVDLDLEYDLYWNTKILNKNFDWKLNLKYSPMFTYNGNASSAIFFTFVNKFDLKWGMCGGVKFGFSYLPNYTTKSFLTFSTNLSYKMSFIKYENISSSVYIEPQLLNPLGNSNSDMLLFWNSGIKLHFIF